MIQNLDEISVPGVIVDVNPSKNTRVGGGMATLPVGGAGCNGDYAKREGFVRKWRGFGGRVRRFNQELSIFGHATAKCVDGKYRIFTRTYTNQPKFFDRKPTETRIIRVR
jgi:hypothetical protein